VRKYQTPDEYDDALAHALAALLLARWDRAQGTTSADADRIADNPVIAAPAGLGPDPEHRRRA
jgi:hypothetical protein